MSIAVSCIVRPSRILRAMVFAMCAAVLAASLLIVFAVSGQLALPIRALIALACIFLAFIGLYHGVRQRKILHIDISADGRLRIAEKGDQGACATKEWPHLDTCWEVCRLLKNSTIWSRLLLLRLQGEDDRVRILTILPDCVTQDDFRALSVACRWIAAHGMAGKTGFSGKTLP